MTLIDENFFGYETMHSSQAMVFSLLFLHWPLTTISVGTNILPKFCTQTHNTNLRVVAVSCTCTLTNSEQQSEYTKSNPPTEIYSIIVVPRLRCTKYREYKHFLFLLSILLSVHQISLLLVSQILHHLRPIQGQNA